MRGVRPDECPVTGPCLAGGSLDFVDRRSWLLLLGLSGIWGGSYLLIKIGLRDLSPEVVAFARIALAALVLLPIAAQRGALAPLRGRLGWAVALGAIQVAGPFLLIAAAERSFASSLP